MNIAFKFYKSIYSDFDLNYASNESRNHTNKYKK